MSPQNLHLKFIDSGSLEASLAEPFDPEGNEIDVLLDEGIRISYPLYDLCCILFSEKPDWAEPAEDSAGLEHIETLTGEHYTVRSISPQRYSQGFFGLTEESDSPYRAVFFTPHGVKSRTPQRHLGTILTEQGLIPPKEIEKALRHQELLRTRRTGEVIAEQTALPIETVESTISEAKNASGKRKIRVGEILVEAGLVSTEQVEDALNSMEKGKKKKIGTLLIERGLITENQLLEALATKFSLRFIDLDKVEPSPQALETLDKELATRLTVLPIEARMGHLVVATSEPTDPTIADILRFNTNCNIELVVAHPKKIEAAIEKFYMEREEEVADLIGEMGDDVTPIEEEHDDDQASESDSHVIKLVSKILIDGFKKGVSDIHFEPGIGKAPFRIRYRTDGICYVAHKISASYKTAIISRLKIIAKLDIAERRRPQSGKILMRTDKRKVEYRLEITPTVGGQEDAVLRILADSKPLPLSAMGFSEQNLENFKSILSKPYGIILCVGPTGSGKTTSLHSALGHINTEERKIWTAEDPVEITQPGLRQVQVHPKIGFTFQEALRSFLRADPDVIMIGEMRDPETAQAAIEASLTGHLVFSTLHTNSAPETVVRLIEMGMDPFNFAEAMLGILAQRLARRLCKHCKEAYHPPREEYDLLVEAYGEDLFKKHGMPPFSEELTLMRAVGCDECGDMGYAGRIAVHELMLGSNPMKRAIKDRLPAEGIKELGIKEGMCTLKMDGVKKVFSGITDLEQILKVCL